MRRFMVGLKSVYLLGVLLAAFSLFAALPMLSCAQAQTTNITVTNSSGWQIKHLYLATAGQDNWGPDQLNGTVVNHGESFTINSAACTGAGLKIITEDQNGCFISHTADCAGDIAWTVTDSETPDCGN